eukprot:tig00000204_g17741.t1
MADAASEAREARADGRRQLSKPSLSRRVKSALQIDKRYFSPYYVVNLAYVVGFMVVHYICGPETDPDSVLLGKYTIEHQLMLSGSMFIVAKSINMDSWDQLWYWVFFFGKGAALLLSYQNGARWLAANFAIFLLLFLTLDQPAYTGPSNLTFLTPANFDWLVGDPNAHHDWLVEAYTTWAFSCTQFAPTFAKLSVEFSSEELRFGKLDVGRFPKLAEKLRIETTTSSKQLPSLLYFSKGKEIARVPEILEDGSVSPFEMNRKSVVRFFGLDGADLAEAAPGEEGTAEDASGSKPAGAAGKRQAAAGAGVRNRRRRG